MITFYFYKAPNPMKVALFLEESGLDYTVEPVDLLRGAQHTAQFHRLNPNEKTPVIVEADGTVVFDSNAILLYLSEKHGVFGGPPDKRAELLTWLMFVATGVGPYSGQCVHFTHMHTDSPYATNRYRREVQRHYAILEKRLAEGRSHLVGETYTIVDMAAWGWVERAAFVLNDPNALDAYPHLKDWFRRIDARPAAQRATALKTQFDFKTDYDAEARRAMFPQNIDPEG